MIDYDAMVCRLGNPTTTDYIMWAEDYGPLCGCSQSCEPHIHEAPETTLCLHDGENDHGHCPNILGDSRSKD